MNTITIQRHLLLIALSFFSISIADITQDLELDNIFKTINYTCTQHGKTTLQSLLARPSDDINLLKNRQTIIAHISTIPELHSQLTTALKKFNHYEQSFTQITQPSSAVQTAALSEFYFSSRYFKQWNYSPIGLELGQIAHFGNLFSSVAQHALAFAFFTWGLGEEHVCDKHPAKKSKLAHKKPHHDDDHSACSHSHHHENLFKQLLKSPAFKYAFQAWHSVAQIQELYAVQSIVRTNLQCIQKMQAELIQLAHGIRVIKNIHEIIKDHADITANLSEYQALKNICFSNDLSPKLTLLLTLLAQPTFATKPSYFSRIGTILAAYKLAQEVGHELQPVLKVIGEIDAYASCAQLLTKHAEQSTCYSFADYITDSNTPLLHAHNFWHPLLSTPQTNLNSINLGGTTDNTRNVVLTGPNGCGKSTNLKAITLCAYLAQTITIVPAQKYSQTIYKEIYSSIIVHDDIKQNLSLFTTELTNAEQLLEKIEALTENEYMFIALDELFTSTHYKKGQTIAQTLLENIYASPQVITIVSTHFEKLIELADSECSCCMNYTVNNFTLEPGIGDPDNSFEILNQKTVSRLLV